MSDLNDQCTEAYQLLVDFCKSNGGISCYESLCQRDSLWPQYPDLVASLIEAFDLYEKAGDNE